MTDSHLGNTLRYLERQRERWEPATHVSHRELAREATRRGLRWQVPAGATCTFPIEDLDGKRGPCGEAAIMLEPPEDGSQAPRCEDHRLDRLLYTGRACDGCGASSRDASSPVEFSYENLDLGSLYCTACCLEPCGPLWRMLALLVFVLTLGCVRPRCDACQGRGFVESGVGVGRATVASFSCGTCQGSGRA